MKETNATIGPRLLLRDRIEIIKSKRFFTLAFSLSMLALIIIIFGIATNGLFFKLTSLIEMIDQTIIIGTMAIAVSFIYTTGNLDISVGSVMAMGAMCGVLVYYSTGNVILMLAVAVAISLILMLLNAILSVLLNIKTILVAIVMIQLYGAIISQVLGPDSLSVDYNICRHLANDGYRYIAFIAYFVFCLIVFRFTSVGRQLRFIGGNQRCATQMGMDSKRLIIISFLMAGIGVGLAATFTIARTASVSTDTGAAMGMNVMLATVLGGMSIYGGAKSNTYSGVIGALTVSALNKGMLMVGISSMVIQGVRGVIFLLLVFLNSERPSTLPSRTQW